MTAGGNVPGTISSTARFQIACISPVAKGNSEAHPEPNAGSENFTSSLRQKMIASKFIVRIDHLLRKTDQIFGRYIYTT